MDELFPLLENNSSQSIITGDFNIDYNQLHKGDSYARKLDDLAIAYGFNQTIKLPTRRRVTESSSTCNDLTFTNATEHTSGVGVISVADHLMNYIVLGKQNTPANHRYVTSRNFKNLDREKMVEDLHMVHWHVIECFPDINDAWHAWKCLFIEIVDKHAPIRKFRAPRTNKIPWYDEETETLKKLRDYYHKRAVAVNLPDDWSKYRQTRNSVTKKVREAKTTYYTSMIKENQGAD